MNLINVAVRHTWDGEEGKRKSSCAMFSSVRDINTAIVLGYSKVCKFYDAVI